MGSGASQSKGSVLIVEDQFLASEFLRIWVEAYGFGICGVAKSAIRAIELAIKYQPDYVLMDVRLEGDRDGVDAALAIHSELHARNGKVLTRFIYCTASNEASTLNRINADHPFAVLIKPIDPAELGAALVAP